MRSWSFDRLVKTPEQPFLVRRGTNISHWLSQSSLRGSERAARFRREDVHRLAEWGFDHVRLPVDEEQLWDNDGRREPAAFDLLDGALDWCEAAGLRVIVDMHILRSHSFAQETDPALFSEPAAAEKFCGLWADLSEHLCSRPVEWVAYELLNEPVAENPESWNAVAAMVHGRLRSLEPERMLVVGSNRWNSVLTFGDLRVPADPRTLLTFHYYHPMLVTHYRASWWKEGGTYDGPVQYPGTPIPGGAESLAAHALGDRFAELNRPFNREAIGRDLGKPLEISRQTGCALYCGEFGAHRLAPFEVRAAWYRDVVSVFEEFGIGWANWDYRGSFALVDASGASTGIAEILLQLHP